MKPSVPKSLSDICLRCLEKDPKHRYASAGELAFALANSAFEREPPTESFAQRPVSPLPANYDLQRFVGPVAVVLLISTIKDGGRYLPIMIIGAILATIGLGSKILFGQLADSVQKEYEASCLENGAVIGVRRRVASVISRWFSKHLETILMVIFVPIALGVVGFLVYGGFYVVDAFKTGTSPILIATLAWVVIVLGSLIFLGSIYSMIWEDHQGLDYWQSVGCAGLFSVGMIAAGMWVVVR